MAYYYIIILKGGDLSYPPLKMGRLNGFLQLIDYCKSNEIKIIFI